MDTPPLVYIVTVEIEQNAQSTQQEHQPGDIPIPAITNPIEIGADLQNGPPGKAKGWHHCQL